jgi:hypothetical protein
MGEEKVTQKVGLKEQVELLSFVLEAAAGPAELHPALLMSTSIVSYC